MNATGYRVIIADDVGYVDTADRSITLMHPERITLMAAEVYELFVRGRGWPNVRAGEGVIEIRATNGVFRYALAPCCCTEYYTCELMS